jgi:uncharacterized membrane protein YqjE
MAELDKQKEKVANYRLGWGLALTSLIGLIAFIFNNYDKLETLKKNIITYGAVILVIIILYLTWKLNKETNKLEEL